MKQKLINKLKKFYGTENYNAGRLYKYFGAWYYKPFVGSPRRLGRTLTEANETADQWLDEKEQQTR